MLRDGAANQSAAVQWPELMNHPKELAEIISGPAENMTIFNIWSFSFHHALYPLEYFVILEH